jgi:hypothetical protein
MTHRQVAHGVAAVGPVIEAFADLTREQVADHIFLLGRDVHGARLERRQPVRVDVREHARGGAELQERNVLALCHGTRELRLHFDDVGIGEPADQVDIMHREINDDSNVRHARWKRTDPRDRDRKNLLPRQRVLDRLDRRVEALHVTDHERPTLAPGRHDDGLAFFHCRSDRLFHQHVTAGRDAIQSNGIVQMGRCRDGHRVDAGGEQFLVPADRFRAEQLGDAPGHVPVRIGQCDELDARELGQHTGMVRAHHADADHADANTLRISLFLRIAR